MASLKRTKHRRSKKRKPARKLVRKPVFKPKPGSMLWKPGIKVRGSWLDGLSSLDLAKGDYEEVDSGDSEPPYLS